MRVIKSINTNFAIAVDGHGKRLIVAGKGIGFGEIPREITDLNQIERSFYDIDDIYVSMINSIPEDVIAISSKIIDKARFTIDNLNNTNIVFTLADHINFCIERYRKNIKIRLPIVYDVQHFFEEEYEIGKYGLKLINETYNLNMPIEEASYIALHIINAEEMQDNRKSMKNDEAIEDITRIVEKDYDITIDKSNFNYACFATHMQYLLKRGTSKHLIQSDNNKIFMQVKEEYPKSYESAENISSYLKYTMGMNLSEEDKLYLMLHINRLCTRGESK